MTVGRWVWLVLAFGVLGLTLVELRAEQTRVSTRLRRMEAERIELSRRRGWLEAHVAELRSPRRVRETAQNMHLDVQPPCWEESILDRPVVARVRN